MNKYISFDLHGLVTMLDKYADQYLLEVYAISYSRFLVLLAVYSNQPASQHQIANYLGIGDAVVSRMVAPLQSTGLLTVIDDPLHGRKKQLLLTVSGRKLVEAASHDLEVAFLKLAETSGVSALEFGSNIAALKQGLHAKSTNGTD